MNLLNFYAGPSILSPEIINEATRAIEQKNGMSILEYSHRSDKIQLLFEETKDLLREMMQLDERFEILFLQGGARMQNCMVPFNINKGQIAQYVDTGIWSSKSIEESEIIRETNIIASSKENEYNCIPTFDSHLSDSAYLHITSNNTVHGTQFFDFPKVSCPLIADMSSDILSRRLDFNQFDIIYAGLQKNLGTAGACLVIVNKEIVTKDASIPNMLSYEKHIAAKSMLNTPPVFAVLLCNLTLKWIAKLGGLDEIERKNNEKAALLYNGITESSIFECYAQEESRSKMNVTFYAKNDKLEKGFLDYCTQRGLIGIKGYRLKGGFRASLYNSMPLGHVERLVEVMKEFERLNS